MLTFQDLECRGYAGIKQKKSVTFIITNFILSSFFAVPNCGPKDSGSSFAILTQVFNLDSLSWQAAAGSLASHLILYSG